MENQIAIDQEEALKLFRGWFLNKMTIVRLLIENPRKRKDEFITYRQTLFFEELNHFLGRRHKDRKTLIALKWLKGFFKIYPTKVTFGRQLMALHHAEALYKAFGFEFDWGKGSVKPLMKRVGKRLIEESLK
jgi:hypothetical protein